MNTPKFLIIHCTDYSYTKMYDQYVACNGWHKDRDFPISSKGLYIGYHDLYTGGKHYVCREDNEVGAHCNQKDNGVSLNFQSKGHCVGFDGDIEEMPAMEYALLQKQIWADQDTYKIPNENVRFHRYWAKDKTCPGSLINDLWLKKLLTRPVTIITTPKSPETMCIAQEKVIKEQKEVIAWYEKLFKFFSIS